MILLTYAVSKKKHYAAKPAPFLFGDFMINNEKSNESQKMPVPKYPKINVELVGQDGNAHFILGKVKQALTRGLYQQYGMGPTEIKSECDIFMSEATAGDYDHLLQTCIKWVEVQ